METLCIASVLNLLVIVLFIILSPILHAMQRLLKCFSFLFFIVIMLPFSNVGAQARVASADSSYVGTVALNEIPLAMAQTRIKATSLLENLVSKEFLIARSADNDSIGKLVGERLDAILLRSQNDLDSRSIANSKLEVKRQKDLVDNEVNKLSNHLNSLDRADSYFKREKKKWNATLRKLENEKYSESLLGKVSSLTLMLDSTHAEVASRTEIIFLMLEFLTKADLSLDNALDELGSSQVQIAEMLASSKNPTMFRLVLTDETVAFVPFVKAYVKGMLEDIHDYLKVNNGNLVAVVVFFLFFVYLLYSKKTVIRGMGASGNNYYQQKVGQMLDSPISAALVLVLAFASLLLQDRPYAVKNIILYLSLIPLYLLSRNVLKKEVHRYVMFFFLLIIPIVALSVFPYQNIFFRWSLLSLSVFEILIVAHFFHYRIQKDDKELSGWDIARRRLVYVLLAFALIGFVGAVIGKILMAQVLLQTIFYAVYSAAVLYNSSVLFNGLVISLLKGKKARRINAIRLYDEYIIKQMVKAVNVLATYLWLVVFLKQLKIWEPVSAYVVGVFQYEWTVGALTIDIANILIFVLVIYTSTKLSRAIEVVLEGDVLNKMNLAKGLPHSIAVMVKYSLVVLGVVIAASAVGLEFSNLAVVFGALGVGIGFGLQSIFNNLVSGLILLFERPVKIGDTVEIGTLIGKVKTIGIRSSNIHTIDGAEVIVPNGHLVSNELINWTLSDQKRRIDVVVSVSYKSDPQQVKALLESVVEEHPLILQDPKPKAFFLEMGDSGLDFRLLFWTASYGEWYSIRSEVVMRTFEVLKENGIEIPFPQRDVHIKGDFGEKERR